MPLPPAKVAREQKHTRQYRFQGYEREDGLFDIEGHMTDSKTYGFPNAFRGRIEAGEPIHDMWIRLTLDIDMVVRDIEAVTDSGPYGICPQITPNFKKAIGLQIGAGWRMAVKKQLGGTEGCTHLVEMLGAMATAAYQTMWPALARKSAERRAAGAPPSRPALLGTCHAYAPTSPVVRDTWPEFYEGPESGSDSSSGEDSPKAS
ncbi:DUF2889 domain-containing protein [Limibacillus sp. MBR-115]|jgi:hypothetical protein|uniref:DUF2889 domain-containing protein n=1 Tax=Limibacillus sp. MBR-115 TaxID=3156465 RepID=UPI003396E502